MLITTTENIPGQTYQLLGEVTGITTQSRNVVRNIGANLKNIVGGEIKAYTSMQEDARNQAMERMIKKAEEKGADAIVMMRFDSGSISADMQFVVAYGTAVKFV